MALISSKYSILGGGMIATGKESKYTNMECNFRGNEVVQQVKLSQATTTFLAWPATLRIYLAHDVRDYGFRSADRIDALSFPKESREPHEREQ